MVNEEESFPIEQSYINLAIVDAKDQQEKEKMLQEQDQKMKEREKQKDFNLEKQHGEIIGTYEEIYGHKTSIDVENIFQQCKDQIKKVLVLGRAGIGKSTFCQYVTYRWAKGELWSEYKLVILIRLRRLTDNRYPPRKEGKEYSLIDLVKKEYSPCEDLSAEQTQHFKELCKNRQVLWILDGYDEFAQNIPEQLKDVFDHVRETQHHILTSRPYAIKSSYDVKLEITGFTNDNIVKYVEQFFVQITKEINNDSSVTKKLLRLLKSNSSIWGVAHIPVNLELICSLWSNNDWTETTVLTITVLYDNIIEWQCKRHLARQNIEHKHMTKQAVYKRCDVELQFLERLAFKAMDYNKIMLTPAILIEAENDIGCCDVDLEQLLKMGILKSYDDKAIGTQNQTEKQHYFVHLSFQEHLAARHLLSILMSTDKVKAINFINNNKYNQRFHFVFVFASGLLSQSHYKSCIESFWSTVQGEPIDLVGVKHIQLTIACIDELINGTLDFPQRAQLIKSITHWLEYCALHNAKALKTHIIQSLQQTNVLLKTTIIQNTFPQLLQSNEPVEKRNIYDFIKQLSIAEPTEKFKNKILADIAEPDSYIRMNVCQVLGNFGESTATNDVIAALINATRDEDSDVRSAACEALGKLGEKAATNEAIAALINATRDEDFLVQMGASEAFRKLAEKAANNEVVAALLNVMRDEESYFRIGACEALGELGEKAATNEVVAALLNAMRDEESYVRMGACEALGELGEKAATNEVIAALLNATRDKDYHVRREACQALRKLGEKAATKEVINSVINYKQNTRDKDSHVRWNACEALGKLGEKALTNEVVAALLNAMRDEDSYVRMRACEAFRNLAEKAATNEVIATLINATRDEIYGVRWRACEALGNLGAKAAANEVIAALINATRNEDSDVRWKACEALGKLGEKAATYEVIAALMNATRDADSYGRREACQALRRLGENAATKEVINSLVNFIDIIGDSDDILVGDLVRFMWSSDGVGSLNFERVGKLCNCIRKSSEIHLTQIPSKRLMKLFLNSRNVNWLRLAAYVALLQGIAVTVCNSIVRIYDTKGVVPLEMSGPELGAIFTEVFTDQRREIEPNFSFGKESVS
ncbi:unnamed protein product [Rotaria magnacalcarata]|uniref:NACHT domain-containing protein n=2 Tax=Rotaria magnacalcarata TaxID=392030 RepID=A0A816W2D0_9BILA|nr:unnamed protein product [Rotaria magnacalcarata]